MSTVLILSGCSLGKGPPNVIGGRDFPGEKIPSVHKGMTADEVRHLLGDPFEIRAVDGSERWRYYVRQRQDENVYVLGFIRFRNPMFIWTDEALVEIRAGLVERIEYRSHKELDKVSGEK